jgi:hypothetical protein
MRALALAAMLTVTVGGIALAQVERDSTLPPPTTTQSGARQQIERQLDRIELSSRAYRLPKADRFTIGNRSIAAGTTVDDAVGVSDGTLDVYGKIDGSAIAIQGDVRVHPGAEIDGDAVAIGGRVIVDGGTIHGEIRSLNSMIGDASPRERKAASPPMSTGRRLGVVAAWLIMLVVIGVGAMIFAERNFDGVVLTLERGFGVSFLVGFAGELALLPLLVVLIVALAASVIGILLIPFAILGYVLGAAGLLTLGFLAVARIAGTLVVSGRGATAPRGTALRAMVAGVVGFALLWAIAAAMRSVPVAGALVRFLSVLITWVAITAGLGAAILSRGGTHSAPRRRGSGQPDDSDPASWQTPTPVAGVAAARRPGTEAT